MSLLEARKLDVTPCENTVNRIIKYYQDSPGYLNGPLAGTCHFGYTPDGESFNLQSSLVSMEVLLAQKLGLPPGSRVLDAGSGFSRVATTLAAEPFGLEIVGVDLIPARLKEARRYTKSRNVSERVRLVNGNYCVLPFGDNTFSGAFTMETLVHADPLEAAFNEFWRVLKPGGRIVHFEYSVPDEATLDPIRKLITDVMVSRIGMTSIGRFTHDAFPNLLEQANFENVNVEDIKKNVVPTWKWMFLRAFQRIPGILRDKNVDYTNFLASFMLWPYQSQLGYKVVTANKPGS